MSTEIDVMGVINQTSDIIQNQMLLTAAEADNNEMAVAMIKLLNEYGIYGNKIFEITSRIEAINRLYREARDE